MSTIHSAKISHWSPGRIDRSSVVEKCVKRQIVGRPRTAFQKTENHRRPSDLFVRGPHSGWTTTRTLTRVAQSETVTFSTMALQKKKRASQSKRRRRLAWQLKGHRVRVNASGRNKRFYSIRNEWKERILWRTDVHTLTTLFFPLGISHLPYLYRRLANPEFFFSSKQRDFNVSPDAHVCRCWSYECA